MNLREYSRVSQSDLPTPAPGFLRISPRPQMEWGRLGEGAGEVFTRFTKGTTSELKIDRNLWKSMESGLVDRY